MTDRSNVQPIPDLADVVMKPAPDPASVDVPRDIESDDPTDPPAADLTIPTE